MNILDKAIAFFSPRRAFERLQYRRAVESFRNWDAARVDRLGSGWTPATQTPEETDGAYRDRICARGRDLERNSEIAVAALRAILRNVVSTGIMPQAHVLNKDGTPNEELNDQLEDMWAEWASVGGGCDITGGMSFYEMQSMILRRRIVDGEAFILKVTPKKGFPLTLQLLEPDNLSNVTEYRSQNQTHRYGGVEVDTATGRPIAYIFIEGTKERRVPAEQIIHFFNRFRPRQYRGVSELAVVMERIRDANEYMDAELVAARVAACFAGFVTTENPAGHIGRKPESADGQRLESIEPGMVNYLRPGERIDFAQPGRPNENATDFLSGQERLIGAGLGLSYEVLTRDMSRVNYSSARQGHLEDRQEFKIMQQSIVQHICIPIWKEFVTACVLDGRLRIPDFFADRRRYTRARWVTPGWSWIDPMKEASAGQLMLASGLETLESLCAARGMDWQDVLEQRARELAYMKELGVPTLATEGSVVLGGQGESAPEGEGEPR